MTYAEAYTEFSIRLYRWSKGALEKEILDGFSSFELNNDGSKQTCRFFQTLDSQAKTFFAQGLLQSRHETAVKALGEAKSTEAEVLLRREEAFRSENNAWARAGALESSCATRTLATRQQLRKAMAAHFRAAFGNQCLPRDPMDGKSDLRFRMECRGWVIKTEFEFGRWDPEIRCEHFIWTGKLITKDEPQVLFANCLGFRLNYGNEIGIGSGWDEIAVNAVDRTCLAVVGHCQRMFDILPELLEGLDQRLLTN